MAIKDKLQGLLGKVTGKDIIGDNVEEVIADAEAKYEGGGTGGSTVVANPTLAGDEVELTGLEVDGTKFKVGGGSKKYRLHIKQNSMGENTLISDIICDVDTNTINSYETLLNYLKDNYKSIIDDDLNEYSRNVLTAYGYITDNDGTTSIFGITDYFEDNIDGISILGINETGVTFGGVWLVNDGLTFEYLN